MLLSPVLFVFFFNFLILPLCSLSSAQPFNTRFSTLGKTAFFLYF